MPAARGARCRRGEGAVANHAVHCHQVGESLRAAARVPKGNPHSRVKLGRRQLFWRQIVDKKQRA
jgi:hypothetical protein